MELAEVEQRVGQTLCGKWKLERLLGVGGMAAVYASVHKIGRRDAIKILHVDVTKNVELRARFEQEAHVANRFKHPGAVEIRDIDITEDGCPLLVMELLEGQTLSEKARQGPLELAALLRYVDELLDVLAAAHKEGIIHRDIKLDNLFITTDDKLKVLDFGIARVRDGSVSSKKTAYGATLGTAPYMPPEQVQGRDIDGRADVFAVGATMFRLLARRRIHEAASEPEMLAKMATQPAPSLASVAPSVPTDVGTVVDRALRFRKEDRYPDAGTMQADVRAIRNGLEPTYAATLLRSGDMPASSEVTSLAPTPLLGRAARAQPTMAASPSSPRAFPSTEAAPFSATFAPASGATASASGTEATVEAAPRSMAEPAVTSRVPVQSGPLLGTLKSAEVVALPEVAPNSRSPEAVSAAIEVVKPSRKRSSSMSLLLFGGAFVALGAIVGGVVYAAMNSSSSGNGAAPRVEEGEPRHQTPPSHLVPHHEPAHEQQPAHDTVQHEPAAPHKAHR